MGKTSVLDRRVGTVAFILRVLLFLYIFVCTFLPFREWVDFYGKFQHPYELLALPLLACGFGLVAIRHPWVTVFATACTFAFFFLIAMPIVVEAAIVGLSSPWIGGKMGIYRSGYYGLAYASHVLAVDVPFALYSIVRSLNQRTYLI